MTHNTILAVDNKIKVIIKIGRKIVRRPLLQILQNVFDLGNEDGIPVTTNGDCTETCHLSALQLDGWNCLFHELRAGNPNSSFTFSSKHTFGKIQMAAGTGKDVRIGLFVESMGRNGYGGTLPVGIQRLYAEVVFSQITHNAVRGAAGCGADSGTLQNLAQMQRQCLVIA